MAEGAKMKEAILSIIVPVYNTEKYLKRCIDSVLKQSLKEIELILVNDCSPGNAEELIKAYKDVDARIKYVRHDVNKGLFRARLTGSSEATGKYIAFLDSDDYVSRDYYRMLIQKATTTDSDIVIGKTVLEKTDGKRYIQNFHDSCFEFDFLEHEQIKDAFFKQKGSCYAWHTVWNKIYRKELWDRCFPYYDTITGHVIMTEDIAFSTLLLYNAQKISTIQSEAYFYCENGEASTNVDSITINRYEKNVKDLITVFNFVKGYLEEVKAPSQYQEAFLEFRKHYARLWRELGENVFIGAERKRAVAVMEQFLPNYKEHTTPKDHFFEEMLTKWNGGLEYIKEQILDSHCEYVSFDIFDTVVTRPLYRPMDLFKLMDKKIQAFMHTNISFSKMRIQAEEEARRQTGINYPGYQDVTIDEIYNVLQKLYKLPEEVTHAMLEEEKQLEIAMCHQRRTAKELFDLAISCGKKVIFISDMYLDELTIKSILNKNDYKGYEKLFLSSTYRLTKHSGALFKEVLQELGIDGEQVIHIGDTWRNDIENARAYNIQPIFLPKAIEVFENKIGGVCTGDCGSIFYKVVSLMQDRSQIIEDFGFRTMLAMVANKYFDNPYRSFNESSDFNADPYFIGYYALGMHLLGLSNYLAVQGKALGYENICFMARDGYLPMKAYQCYTKNDSLAPKAKYIYTSRKAVLPAMIKHECDFYDLPVEYRNHTCQTILKLLSFCTKQRDEEGLVKELKANGLIANKHFESKYEFNHFMNYFIEHIYDKKKHEKALEQISGYFKQEIGERDITFDLGYSGRIQGALSHAIGHPVDVFFIHQDSNRADLIKQKDGFAIYNFYDFVPTVSGLMREHLISSPKGSCIGYIRQQDKVVPILEDERKNYEDVFIIDLIQKGALQFIQDYMQQLGEYSKYIGFRNHNVSLPYEGYLRCSKEVDRRIFKGSYFEDLVYGAKEHINIYDFINGQYDISLNQADVRSTGSVGEVDYSLMVDRILWGKGKAIKCITYAVFDRKTLKEKVKRKLGNSPRLLNICRRSYKVLKKLAKRH